jgi:hypothetical protein
MVSNNKSTPNKSTPEVYARGWHSRDGWRISQPPHGWGSGGAEGPTRGDGTPSDSEALPSPSPKG